MDGKSDEKDEPGDEERCPSTPRQDVTAQLIESSPAAPAVRAAGLGSRGMPSRVRSRPTPDEIEDPDADLVDRWQSGDEGAFETLVRLHQRRVFGLVMRMLGDRQEAEDVAQEAFLSLHRHGHRFRREARFSTFVYRVAANAALNRRRTLGRKRAREEALARRQDAGFDLPSSPRDPEDATAGGEVQVQVQEALLLLSEDLRAAIILYDIEGQSYGEIAKALGIPEGTVKSRIHRARNALREHLRPLARATGETGGVVS